MNYLILKSILEATITHFQCKHCGGKISETDINLLGVAGNALNFEIICPSCKMPGVIKAEVGMAMGQKGDIAGQIKNIIPSHILQSSPTETPILDKDIVSLRESLKNCQSLEELFKS